MKIIYCHCSLYNPGGMERVLLNKVRWIRENRPDWEILIVTTDQQGRVPFYVFPDGVRMIDLGINYSLDNSKPVLDRIPSYLKKRRLHRIRLSELLMQERADVTVSLYPSESSFIPDIKDGSKKVLELHFSRFFRIQYGRKGVLGLIDRYRSLNDKTIASRFDRFVVLSNEDANDWGKMTEMSVIPNASMKLSDNFSDGTSKRVIAVGRLDYQKGFDRLIEAWTKVIASGRFNDWILDIYGQGEWHDMLVGLIKENGIQHNCRINAPVSDIAKEYCESSILVMSSNYEGFPMVMIEGMSAGLPVVSFDFKCGPKDIIQQDINGLLVKNGDINGLAESLMVLMADDEKRVRMGKEARRVTQTFSEEVIMSKWMNLFEPLKK